MGLDKAKGSFRGPCAWCGKPIYANTYVDIDSLDYSGNHVYVEICETCNTELEEA